MGFSLGNGKLIRVQCCIHAVCKAVTDCRQLLLLRPRLDFVTWWSKPVRPLRTMEKGSGDMTRLPLLERVVVRYSARANFELACEMTGDFCSMECNRLSRVQVGAQFKQGESEAALQ